MYMENNFNLDKQSKKIALFLLLIFVSLIISVFFYINYNRVNLTYASLLEREKHTRVVDIYINKEEHNFIYVKYSNGKRESLDDPYQIGDSISKNKGDSIEYIFRKQEVIRNNLLENYRNNN